MIVSFDYSVTVFTDYKANSKIIAQIKLFSTFVDKLNLRLVKISIYLSQYRIRVFHKNDKTNIVFDALFRLFIKKHNVVNRLVNSLNVDVFNENAIKKNFVEISDEFRRKLIKEYKKNFV